MDQELRDAVYGNKPTMQYSADPIVNQSVAATGRAPLVHAIANANLNQSQMNLDEQKKAEAAAKQSAADMQDPKKFQRVAKPDGGFGFFDPSGKEITAHDYARAVGAPVDKVLADSENPIDANFVNDYKNLQNYLTAWQNNDKAKIDAIQKQSPELAKIKDPQELLKRFMQAYPTVYGKGGFAGAGTAGQRTGSSFVPTAQAGASNDSYIGSDGGIGL